MHARFMILNIFPYVCAQITTFSKLLQVYVCKVFYIYYFVLHVALLSILINTVEISLVLYLFIHVCQ